MSGGGMGVAVQRDLARLQAAEALIAMGRVSEIPSLLVGGGWRTSALLRPRAHRSRWLEILDAMADKIDEQLGKDDSGNPDETLVTVTARLLRQLSAKRFVYTKEQEATLRGAMWPLSRYRARHTARLPPPTPEDLFAAADTLCRYGRFAWATSLLGDFDGLKLNGRTLPYDDPYRVKARERLEEVNSQKALQSEDREDWLEALADRKADIEPAELPQLVEPQSDGEPAAERPPARPKQPRCPRPPRALKQPARNADEFFAGLGITWDGDGEQAVVAT